MRDPVTVHRVALPVSRPFTGRYALFQPLNTHRVPNDEDHLGAIRIGSGRFSNACILDARLENDGLLVSVWAAQDWWRFATEGHLEIWRFHLGHEEAPRLMERRRAELSEALKRPVRGPDPAALLRTDGTRLYARLSPTEPFEPVRLTDLAEQFAKDGRLDFLAELGRGTFFHGFTADSPPSQVPMDRCQV